MNESLRSEPSPLNYSPVKYKPRGTDTTMTMRRWPIPWRGECLSSSFFPSSSNLINTLLHGTFLTMSGPSPHLTLHYVHLHVTASAAFKGKPWKLSSRCRTTSLSHQAQAKKHSSIERATDQTIKEPNS